MAMAFPALAQTKQDSAWVVRVKGAARYMPAGGTWQELKVGTVLRPGCVVQTEKKEGAYVDLALGGEFSMLPSRLPQSPFTKAMDGIPSAKVQQNVIRLAGNTVLALDKLLSTETGTGAGPTTEVELDLRKGKVLGNVKKMTAGSKFEIRYQLGPDQPGVAAIRGTSFSIELVQGLEAGPFRVIVYITQGSAVVQLKNAAGNTITQTVLSGMSFDSSNPTTTTPIPPQVLQALTATLESMSLPPTIIPRVMTTSHLSSTYMSATQ
jgi:hypothetical protein